MNKPSESLHSKTIYAIIFIGSISFHLHPVSIMKLDTSAHYSHQTSNSQSLTCMEFVHFCKCYLHPVAVAFLWTVYQKGFLLDSVGDVELPRLVWISVSCHVKWDLFLRGLWSERGQNIYFKLHIDVPSFSSASHHLIFLCLCMPVSARLFCDRISLLLVFCAPQWHFY